MSIRLAFIVAMLGACALERSLFPVSPEVYLNLDRCWEREGKFQSFVVLHEEGSKYYPYFISPWCDVQSEDYPKGLGFVPYITALQFANDKGALKDAMLFEHNLESTTPTHSPLPLVNDWIYVYIGSVERLENDGFFYYRISNPTIFQRTDLTLKDLTEKTPEARLQLFNEMGLAVTR